MRANPKIAIVTPYFKESSIILERCITSVKNQKYANCDHFLIGDGVNNKFIDQFPAIRHFSLDKNFANNGNTPRGFGCMMAITEEYDAIFLLDADNWFESNHVYECIRLVNQSSLVGKKIDYVYSDRYFRRPDGSLLNWRGENNHIDTSCLCILPGAFFELSKWGMMPDFLSPICDKIFFNILKINKKIGYATRKKTVNFTMLYGKIYEKLGERIPEEADHLVDWESIASDLKNLSKQESIYLNESIGLPANIKINIS